MDYSGFTYGMYGLGFMIVFLAVMLLLAVVVVCYVFFSLGLYRIAKRRGIDTPGLAWVPIVQMWTVGCLAMDYDRRTKQKSMRYDHLLLWFSVALFIVALIATIVITATKIMNGGSFEIQTGEMYNNWLVMMPATVTLALWAICLLKIYQSCSPKNYTVLFVLSLVFSIIVPFVLFALRDSDKGLPEVPETAERPQPRPPVTMETPEPRPHEPKIDMTEYDPYPEDAIVCTPEERPEEAETQEAPAKEDEETDAAGENQAEGDNGESKKEDIYEEY